MKTKKYLFICGCPRSGTTALWRLISASDEVAIGVERFVHKGFKPDLLTPGLFEKDRFFKIKEGDTFYSDFSFNPYYEKLELYYHECSVYGDKIPKLYKAYKAVMKNFGSIRFLFIVRNIFDVAVSYNRRAQDVNDNTWKRDQNYRVAVADWNEALKCTIENLPSKDIFVVEYESLLCNKMDLTKLFDFIDVKIDRKIERRYDDLLLRSKELEAHRENALTSMEKQYICSFADFRAYKNVIGLEESSL